ncbi:MAG: Gamma-glutamyl phosphate reductase [Chloroflexi bacterium AL-N5]|nr:Gamma-glutamyl phosphate reductase [Chloroflexi bacterium AL-N5]
MDAPSILDFSATLRQVRRGALTLSKTDSQARNQAIEQLADGLKSHQNELLEANTLDLEMSRELAVPSGVLNWLKLTPERLNRVGLILEQLVHLPNPLTSEQMALPTTQGYVQAAPLGVIGFVYETFPELALILAAMCWKTGNGLLLQGDIAGRNSNQFVVNLLQATLEQAGLPNVCVQALPSDSRRQLEHNNSVLHDLAEVDLIIPYGRPRFIEQVHQQSKTPALCPTLGNCYLYWSESCGSEPVKTLIIDSHDGCPEAINAIEKVLIPPNLKTSRLTLLWGALKEQGFELRGDAELVAEFPELTLATKAEWSQPYLQKTIAFKRVADLGVAIQWMNAHSHGQADCLVTDSYSESRQFALDIQSSTAYINASPRFSRLAAGGQGTVALGICGRRSRHSGVIDLQTLLTTKQVIQGNSSLGTS